MISSRAQGRVVMSATWGILLLVAIVALSVTEASVLLPDGAVGVRLPGTTAAAEPDLAGTVLHDELIPFVIRDAAGNSLFGGVLQNRAVRSRTQLVHFYYRIRDTAPGLPGRIVRVDTIGFPGTIHADYRIDGLGAVAPVEAGRAGERVKFFFAGRPTAAAPAPLGLLAGTESRFFFVKGVCYSFGPGGLTTLVLATGQQVTLSTVRPAR
ncbi:MAG: hypothetical protein RDU83_09940 [bacterium]|nr:hypothetical protein [bacterium]